MNRRRFEARLLAALLLAGAALVAALPSAAVPMWARRYNVECSTCHRWPGYQLTSTGLDFLRRGHRLKGDGFDKDFTHLIAAHVEWEYDFAQGQNNAFKSPDFHIHAGGAFTESFSGFLSANVNNAIEAAYLQYTKERGDDVYFTARGGKLTPTLLRNYGNGLGTAGSDPLILSATTLGANPFTPDRTNLGVDVGWRWKAFFVQGGVGNGEDVAGVASVGHHKDAYATAEYTLPDGVSGVGLYYFHGGYNLGDPAAPPLQNDTYNRQGVFANYTRDRFRLAGAYLFGKDHLAGIADRKIRGYFGQIEVQPAGWWFIPFVRYDETKTQDPAVGDDRIRMGTAGVSVRIFYIGSTSARAVFQVSRQQEQHVHTNSGLVNLIWAF